MTSVMVIWLIGWSGTGASTPDNEDEKPGRDERSRTQVAHVNAPLFLFLLTIYIYMYLCTCLPPLTPTNTHVRTHILTCTVLWGMILWGKHVSSRGV